MSFAKKALLKIRSQVAFYQRLGRDTEGASGIEYAIIAGMVAVALAAFVTPISTAITTMFNGIVTALTL